ncbi:unnamed protein product [Clonostachys rosea]|uniref:SnoaL-like domain-containing protein n=1 Tax=Bionectria ochroleuca TaxID=29856 RepID=A0ABY6V3D1_BIOOC|nr:unnamed protein product [Clonostachys rosea]
MDAYDVESTTLSTLTGLGAATPTTAEGYTAIQEWLRSSQPKEWSYSEPEEAPKSTRLTRLSEPHAGTTVLIIDKELNRALACHDGDLTLENVGDLDSLESIPVHWQWFSTDTEGFKGFRSVANGGFLGHDIWWDFYARVHHHLGWEQATLSKREEGCYWIQFEHWWTQRQLCARGDGKGVFWQQDGGTLWEFVEVHGARD